MAFEDAGPGRLALGPRNAAVLLAVAAWACAPSSAEAQATARMQASRQIGSETELFVLARFGAGEFTVLPAPAGQLYRVQLRYDEDAYRPVHEMDGNRLTVGVDGEGRGFPRGSSSGELILALTDRLPIDLDLEFGAVEANLELGGLRLRSLELSTGASDAELRVSTPNPEPMRSIRFEVGAASFKATDLGRLNAEIVTVEAGVGDVRLDFGGLQRAETRVSVEIGLGSLEIRIPREAGIRLTRDTFLAPLEAPGLERDGDVYVSPDWEASPMRVLLDIDAAFGSLSVIRTD